MQLILIMIIIIVNYSFKLKTNFELNSSLSTDSYHKTLY